MNNPSTYPQTTKGQDPGSEIGICWSCDTIFAYDPANCTGRFCRAACAEAEREPAPAGRRIVPRDLIDLYGAGDQVAL